MKDLFKNKKVIIIGAVVILAIILLLVFLIFNIGSGNKTNKNTNENTIKEPVEEDKIDEKDIKDAYDLSGEDAIKLVKEQFNTDTFNFSFEVSPESKYIVTAKSKVEGDNTIFKFEVDPVTKSFYAID